MKRAICFASVLMLLPLSAQAATFVSQGGSPYDVQADDLFFGIVSSELGGAGSYAIDFFNPTGNVLATADAAVTSAAVETLFTDLTISWIDGRFNNTLVQVAGVDTLTTEFSEEFQFQRLLFGWSDSLPGTAFGFDVETEPFAVPIPGAIPLFLVGISALALARRGGQSNGKLQQLSA